MSEELLLRLRYEENDFVDVARLRLARALSGRTDLKVAAIACVIAIGLAYFIAPWWAFRLAVWMVAIALAITTALVAAGLYYVPRLMFRRSMANRPELHVELSEEGITLTAGGKRALVAWARCASIEEDARTHILHYGDKGILVVPHRAFQSERQAQTFRSLIDRFVAKKGTPARSP